MYHTLITLQQVSKDKINHILNTLIDASVHNPIKIKAFRNNLEDTDLAIFDTCVNYIKSNHKLSPDHLGLLVAQGNGIEDLWPKNPLELSDICDTITDYAKRSPEELWAESFRLHATGIMLPTSIKPIMVKSLSVCKAG